MTHITKSVIASKKPRKQHSPEFRSEALKLTERIGVTSAARELSLYESQPYVWRSKIQQQKTSSQQESEQAAEITRLKRQLAEQDEERGCGRFPGLSGESLSIQTKIGLALLSFILNMTKRSYK